MDPASSKRPSNLRLVVALAAVGALAIVLFAFLGRGAREQQRTAGSSIALQDAVVVDSHEQHTDATGLALASESERARAEAAEPNEHSTGARQPVSGVHRGKPNVTIRVQVLDTSHAPVPGVLVSLRALHSNKGASNFEIARARTNTEQGIAAITRPTAGTVRMYDVEESAGFVLACEIPRQQSVSIALPKLDDGGELHRLVLPEDAELWFAPIPVQVVDTLGTPQAGVDVELIGKVFGAGGEDDELRPKLASGKSAQDGLAQLPRRKQLELVSALAATGESHEFYLTYDLAGVVPARVLLPDPIRNAPPLRLVVPLNGKVAVDVVDATGAVAPNGTVVSLSWRDAAPQRASLFRSSPHSVAAVFEGRARFEHVGIGLELKIEVHTRRDFDESGELVLLGPVNRDQEIATTLRLTRDPLQYAVAARIIDVQSMPVANTMVWASVRAKSSTDRRTAPSEAEPGHTNDDGRVRFVLPAVGEGACTLELSDQHGALRSAKQRRARIELARPPEPGTTQDLGDIMLVVPPPARLLVAGVVVDEADRPMKSVRVRVSTVLERDGEQAEHELPLQEQPKTDADGRFEVRSDEDASSVRLSANGPRHLSGSVRDIEPGSADVRVVLRASAIVKGRVLTDAGVDLTQLRVVLTRNGESHEQSLRSHGDFAFAGVAEGKYRVEIRTRSTYWVVDAIDDVSARDGETTADVRLAEIDLHEKTRSMLLALRDESGAACPRAWVMVQNEQGLGGRLLADEEGRVRVLAPANQSRFLISGRGVDKHPITWSAGECVIVLKLD